MDADRELATLAAQAHGVFTLADARDAGLSHRQIDLRVRDEWVTLYEGVFLAAGAPAIGAADALQRP